VLLFPAAGNAYYILAQAYIAAQLNRLDGVSFDAVEPPFAAATAILAQYTPAQIAALKGKAATALRAQLIALATELDAFNRGLTGPGRCDGS
jgi:hypothetical protein